MKLHGLMYNWEIASIHLYSWKSWDQGTYLLPSKDKCQEVTVCHQA